MFPCCMFHGIWFVRASPTCVLVHLFHEISFFRVIANLCAHASVMLKVYDGHHRDHGLAYQAVMAPNGMLMDAWGPVSGRRHDSYLLRVSELKPRLAAVQDPHQPQMKVYGDAAYRLLSHVRRGFKGVNLTEEQRAFNQANSKLRISIEWVRMFIGITS